MLKKLEYVVKTKVKKVEEIQEDLVSNKEDEAKYYKHRFIKEKKFPRDTSTIQINSEHSTKFKRS